MLLEFTVENYRSYRDRARLSLVASSAEELPENLVPVEGRGLSVVKSAVLYGANGSGKSNLLAAMNDLAALVESPTRRRLSERTVCKPFAFQDESAKRPMRLGAAFVLDDVLYEYEVGVCGLEVVEEKLTAYPKQRPQLWIRREAGKLAVGRALPTILKEYAKNVPAHQTFLGFAAALEAPRLAEPAKWLARNLRTRWDLGDDYGGLDSIPTTTDRLESDARFKEWVENLLKHADVGISGVGVEDLTHDESARRASAALSEKLNERKKGTSTSARAGGTVGRAFVEIGVELLLDDLSRRRKVRPYFIHENQTGGFRRFNLSDESHGTRRLFDMCLPFFNVLSRGEVAVIDEFSASLHPLIVRELVRLFHDPRTNPHGAQLIFATHDTNLLSSRLFRRDQVWFTEKDRSGATELYSLHDVKDVRPDEAFEKGYLRGRYGAIPFLGEFDFPIPAVAADGE